jgi:catechol 2,3-dioxygenase-like lactoylglutathione lyase family enzyme
MKRLHVHVAVKDLEASVRFYSPLFSASPKVQKPDYAKWMLDDPRVNFAISSRGAEPGVDHLGIQVEDRSELEEVYGRLKAADAPVIEEGETVCCYAQSEKSWIQDPQGVQWETFLTSGESTVYGTDLVIPKDAKAATAAAAKSETACCAPSCCSPQ